MVFLTAAWAQTTMTGNDIIINLNTLSLAYEDLISLARKLPQNLADDGQKLVERYTGITATERRDENLPQPTEPFSEAVQYGIAAASHALVLEDRRFLNSVSDNYVYFGLLQRQKLVKLLRAQLAIVKKFDQDDAAFGPEVLNILQADDAILIQSLEAAVAVFKAHSK